MSPLYSYSCQECGHDFDSLMRAYEPVECARCKSRTVTKQITMPACYIRGGGDWSTSQKPNKSKSTEK